MTSAKKNSQTISDWKRAQISKLQARKSYAEIFNDRFYDAIYARKENFDRAQTKIIIVQAVLTLALLVCIYPSNFKISIAGLSSDLSGSLRELLLFVAASITLHWYQNVKQSETITDLLQARTDSLLPNDKIAQRFYGIRYDLRRGAEFFGIADYKSGVWTGTLQVLHGAGLIFGILGKAFALLYVQFLGLVDIVTTPSFSSKISWLVVIYVVAVNVVVLASSILSAGKHFQSID